MVNVARLKKEKITANGYYFGLEDGLGNFSLSDEDIRKARLYFRDNGIAYKRDVVMSNRQQPINKKRYKKASHQKYNDKRHTRKGNLVRKIETTIVVGGTILTITFLAKGFFLPESLDVSSNAISISQVEQLEIDDNFYNDITTYASVVDIENSQEEAIEEEVEEEVIDEDMQNRKLWIQKYSDIFQVDADIVYERLDELSNHFEDPNYLDGYIPNLTCKGQEVHASCEEVLILYFVRCVKQLPNQLGIEEDVSIQNGYTSTSDYASQIGYFASLLEVDPCLVYAIIQAETGWDSDLFLNTNNPAGLVKDGSWWTFSSKEEGFIELMLEIQKYNRMGAYTIQEIGNIHAPVEDGNENWVPLVTQIYEEVSSKQEELFGETSSHYLKH